MTIHVTGHAIERFQSRVTNLTDDEVRSILSSRAIQVAANFGAQYVRLGTGERVVLQGETVVTVLPAENFKRQIARKGLGRYGRSSRWETEQ